MDIIIINLPNTYNTQGNLLKFHKDSSYFLVIFQSNLLLNTRNAFA